jgi:hypothetical protein
MLARVLRMSLGVAKSARVARLVSTGIFFKMELSQMLEIYSSLIIWKAVWFLVGALIALVFWGLVSREVCY